MQVGEPEFSGGDVGGWGGWDEFVEEELCDVVEWGGAAACAAMFSVHFFSLLHGDLGARMGTVRSFDLAKGGSPSLLPPVTHLHLGS